MWPPIAIWGVVATVAAMAVVAPPVEGARAFFVFGDSLVDNGNNNFLLTTARADSPPYGIDYPTHRPTGRFSNGYNIPDLISSGGSRNFFSEAKNNFLNINYTHMLNSFILFSFSMQIYYIMIYELSDVLYVGQALGAESTLPYLSPELRGEKLLVGANFASAGIGILNDTGIQFANIIRISGQLEFFRQYQARVSAIIGEAETQQRVNGALVLITLGGNDFVNNYFLTPINPRRIQFNIQNFSRFLISEYKKILLRLYELGARRVLVTGTGPLGCVPSQLATGSRNGQCVAEPQRAAAIFNPLLVQMIGGLNRELGSDIFVAANAMQMQNDFITNPQAFGFITSKVACCGQGPNNGVGICTAVSNLCPNREIYAFWDPFHPTERANKIIVQTILTGSDKYMSPMNLSTIMALDSMT